jgi:sensor c-di-GMP phosphodiesterase-like protein
MISIETMLAGLNQGEFFLEYLPTVSLADGHCTGAEALVRWRRPTGVVLPLDFIPEAENTFISGLITYWVFDTVAAEIGTWLRAHPDAHISINVPPEVLGRGGILYAAQKSGLVELASQLILEITERGVPDLLGIETVNLSGLLGVRIALDDVTMTGAANLAIMGRTKLDIIKIDKSLVALIGTKGPRPPWLRGIAALLRSSPLMVIAEGVETEQQSALLRKAGIQEAQGFYFSPPVSAEQFIAYHRQAPTAPPQESPRRTGSA